MTEWKLIKWNYYMNKDGIVKNMKTNKIRKCSLDKDGYYRYKIGNKKERYGFGLHRKLAELFIPNPDNLPITDHINRIRDDNRLDNLRWASYKTSANNRDNSRLYLNFPQYI